MAALLGGPLFRPALDACISALQDECAVAAQTALDAKRRPAGSPRGAETISKRQRLRNGSGQPSSNHVRAAEDDAVPLLPPGALGSTMIQRGPLMSLERFYQECMCAPKGGRPYVLTGGIEHWPARQLWGDLSYLRTIAGARTVPVEVGRDYLAAGWGQRLMTVSEFIDQHILGGGGSHGGGGSGAGGAARGYLAQHELFEQIPALRRDICEPEYCGLGAGDRTTVNAWFGPPATVTPLHTDPYHNLLAQVVGRKYVRLYHPDATPALYPFKKGFTTNCSQVDVDAPDEGRFPDFPALEHFDAILAPGDMLYIPPRWWHYVKSLTVSFSVSFWWQ